ncbi:MFS transporter [Rhodococcus maanshanensis]|uniref:MFS transporter n=1 Tax=Rhodococcus maanshanensis TaxID=183556 RepID=UPI0022B57FA4|nr:MFS transporter [Rhodococcus maanshanensis]MCZ4556596.1 MFS transporter [Rhodococcus maanshanensis]
MSTHSSPASGQADGVTPSTGEPAKRVAIPVVLIGAVILAMFMAVLDQTIVGTALPRIAEDINGAHLYTWVVTSYLLTSTVFVPIFGTLSDRFGHKRLLVLGIVVFACASIACGLAGDATVLIAARAVQGVGAAVLVTVPLALMLELAPAEKAVQIQSAFGAIIALSLLIGPYLGGLLSDQLSWHWVFFINVPIAAFVLLVVLHTLGERPRDGGDAGQIDWAGFFVFSLSVCLLLVGFSNKGGSAGSAPLAWHDTSVWPLVTAGIVGFAVFVVVEQRVRNPIIPVRTLRQGRLGPTLIASFAVAFLMYPAIIFIPRYFQTALGTSATESAMRAFPLMLGLVLGMVVLGAIVKATGRYRWPLVGFGVIAILGLALLRELPFETGAQTYVGLAFLGVGIGPMISGLMMVAQHSLSQHDVGLATSSVTFFRQIGGTVSLAFAGSVFASGVQQAKAAGISPREAVAPAVSDVVIHLGGIGAIVVIACVLVLPSVDLIHDIPPNEEQ